MKIYAEDGQTIVGKLIGKKIVQLELKDGTSVSVVGDDYTILGQGKSEVSIVCEEGNINKEILPKKKEQDEKKEEVKKDDTNSGDKAGEKDSGDDSRSGGDTSGEKAGSDKADDKSSAGDDKKPDDEKGGKSGEGDTQTERKFTKL